MLDLSPLKLMIIVAVILLVMGPDKLPEVAHRLGAGWRALKRIQERVEAEVREAIPDLPSTGDIARIARSPVNLLNQLADRVDAKEADASAESAVHASSPDAVDDPPLIAPRPPSPPPVVEGPSALSDPSLN